MSAGRKLVHITRVPIRWGDMDAQGHVNNTLYFRYMEQARIEWVTWLDERCGGFPGQGSVIVNASCTFIAPLTYPGTVEVRMYLDPPGRSSIGTHMSFGSARPNTPKAAPSWCGSTSARSARRGCPSGVPRWPRRARRCRADECHRHRRRSGHRAMADVPLARRAAAGVHPLRPMARAPLQRGSAQQGAIAGALAIAPPVLIAACGYWALDQVSPLLGLAWNVLVLYLLVGFRHFSHAFSAIVTR
jgi:Predicted thioesterase